jgi:hypothetical protein
MESVVTTQARVRNGETQAEIDLLIEEQAQKGVALLYFNSQRSLNEWVARVKALSQ